MGAVLGGGQRPLERTFAGWTNFRRLNRDNERLAVTLRALHVSADALTPLTRALRGRRLTKQAPETGRLP